MRSRVLVGTVTLLLCSLVGCSSDAETGAPGETSSPSTPPSSETPTGTTADTPSDSPTDTPSASPTPEPAAGPEVVATDLGEPVLTLRAPTRGSWEVQPGGDNASSIGTDGGLSSLGGRSIPVTTGKDLAYYVGLTRKSVFAGLELERSANRVVDGIEGYVLEGTDSSGYYYYFGAIYGDVQVEVFFRLPRDDASAHALIDSVLASATWV